MNRIPQRTCTVPHDPELDCRLAADANAALAWLIAHPEDWLDPGEPVPSLTPKRCQTPSRPKTHHFAR